MVCTDIGSAFQSSKDASFLREMEDELLNEDAQALTDLLREHEEDVRAQKHFGVESYSQLSPGQRLADIIFHMPIVSSESENRVLEASMALQDEISDAVMKGNPLLSRLTLYSYAVDFTLTPSHWTYSVSSNGEEDPIIHIATDDVSVGSSPPSENRETNNRGAMEKAQWVLDKIEDHALGLIYPGGPRRD
jgi:hypothetical protein